MWVSVGDIHPDPRNPRDNAAAVAKVAASIERFGFASPIVARLADGVVIAGHTRLLAAASLGLDVVPVRYLDLDPADARLLGLADNRLGEIATWSDDELGDLLRELRDEGLDLTVAGFDDAELDALLGELGGEGGDESGDSGALPSPPIAGSATRHAPHLINGDCLAALREMPDASVDAVITDPPYGLGFMAAATKGWDAPDMAWATEWARECLRVLKPGGHLLAWASDRTDHHVKIALEGAGFDIRRTFAWVTWQGFPKSVAADLAIDRHLGALDRRPVVSRGASGRTSWGNADATEDGPRVYGGGNGEQGHDVTAPATPEAARWYGYGTDVKPANEPAILARKPLEGTLAENLIKWGTGALHIDAARHAPGDPLYLGPSGENWSNHIASADKPAHPSFAVGGARGYQSGDASTEGHPLGRFPSSLVFAPKVNRREREWGCEGLEPRTRADAVGREPGSEGASNPRAGASREGGDTDGVRNFHPTLKPIALSRWFVRLLAPGPGSVIVDTFAGSGSGAVAAIVEGHRVVAIEREGPHPDAATGAAGLGYFAILEARCAAALVVDLDALAALEGDDVEGTG